MLLDQLNAERAAERAAHADAVEDLREQLRKSEGERAELTSKLERMELERDWALATGRDLQKQMDQTRRGTL